MLLDIVEKHEDDPNNLLFVEEIKNASHFFNQI